MSEPKDPTKNRTEIPNISESDVLEISNEFSRNALSEVEPEYGYTLATGLIDQKIDLNFDIDQFFDYEDAPALVKDKDENIFIYGLNAEGEPQLTKLENKMFDFSQIPFPSNFKDLIYLEPNKTPRELYTMINACQGHVRTFHYSHFPSTMASEEKTKEKEKMKDFLSKADTALAAFINKFVELSFKLTSADIDLLGTDKETKNGQAVIALLTELEKNGFSGTRNENLNFWSGKYGADKAESTPGEISCSEVPSISVLFSLYNMVSDYLDEEKGASIPNFLQEALSKLYALKAKGHVNVYISARNRADEARLTIGNNFWNAELFTLQQKLRKGEIDSINIHLFDGQNNQWKPPVDINSKEADAALFLIKREARRAPPKNVAPQTPTTPAVSSKEIDKEIKEFDEFQKTLPKDATYSNFMQQCQNDIVKKPEPRPKPLSWGALRKVVAHWKQKTQEHKKREETKVKLEERERQLLQKTLTLWQTKSKKPVIDTKKDDKKSSDDHRLSPKK